MFETIQFQGKLWRVLGKVEGHHVDDPSTLKFNYGCDIVIKNNQNVYYMLDEIIDVEFEDL